MFPMFLIISIHGEVVCNGIAPARSLNILVGRSPFKKLNILRIFYFYQLTFFFLLKIAFRIKQTVLKRIS